MVVALAVLTALFWSVSQPSPEGGRSSDRLAKVPRVTQYREIPGLDLALLDEARREQFVRHLNHTDCVCDCAMTLAECRNIDPACKHSREEAERLLAQMSAGPAATPATSH